MTEQRAGTPSAGRRIRGLDAAERREQRREQLLEAALELFARQGYPNTSVEQICQAAYVGTKAFYELFDGREACYIALLQRISEQIEADMVAVLHRAPDDRGEATRLLIGALVHAVVDDPRRARVTFGEAGAISPAVERQRRTNRRWAAAFLEGIWQRYAVTTNHPGPEDLHRMAIGTIGGMFDLIADWLLDANPANPTHTNTLTTDLIHFYTLVTTALAS